MKAVPLIGIARHRLTIDGEGVTTLVAFHGCPLRCKYCLNPTSLQPNGVWESYNCNQLYEEVRKDELYFLASCGGFSKWSCPKRCAGIVRTLRCQYHNERLCSLHKRCETKIGSAS